MVAIPFSSLYGRIAVLLIMVSALFVAGKISETILFSGMSSIFSVNLWGEIMFEKIRQLIKENGHFDYRGEEYVLIEPLFPMSEQGYPIQKARYCQGRSLKLNSMNDNGNTVLFVAFFYNGTFEVVEDNRTGFKRISHAEDVVYTGCSYNINDGKIF